MKIVVLLIIAAVVAMYIINGIINGEWLEDDDFTRIGACSVYSAVTIGSVKDMSDKAYAVMALIMLAVLILFAVYEVFEITQQYEIWDVVYRGTHVLLSAILTAYLTTIRYHAVSGVGCAVVIIDMALVLTCVVVLVKRIKYIRSL